MEGLLPLLRTRKMTKKIKIRKKRRKITKRTRMITKRIRIRSRL